MIPEPYIFALLCLAAFSLWKLIADDRILDRPRDWLLDQIEDDDRATYWGDFIVCPWCAGFWISGLVYGGWLATLGDPELTVRAVFVGLGVWFAIRAVAGLLGMLVPVLSKHG